MKVGDLVKHRLSERGMTGVITKMNVDERRPVHIVLWDDGRHSDCISDYLEVVSDLSSFSKR